MTDQLPEDQILTKDKIRDVINNKTRCSYRDCIKGAEIGVLIPLTNVKLENVSLPFCKYHAHIVIGGQFTAKCVELLGINQYHMSGPTKEVQLIEQVMAAREIVRKK